MSESVKPLSGFDDAATPEREWVASGLDRFGKLLLADRGRLMLDNQYTLDTTNAADRDNRDYAKRMREAQLEKMYPGAAKVGTGIAYPSEDAMASINIDSPTNNYYSSAPPTTPPVSQPTASTPITTPPSGLSGFAKSALTAAAIAATGAAGVGGTYLAMRQPASTAPVVNQKEFFLKLLPAELKQTTR